jgi:hypothetical protein
MRAINANVAQGIKQLATAFLLTAAAGGSFAAELAAPDLAAQNSVSQTAKPLSKSQATRQQIQEKVARHEPLTYVEKLYLR